MDEGTTKEADWEELKKNIKEIFNIIHAERGKGPTSLSLPRLGKARLCGPQASTRHPASFYLELISAGVRTILMKTRMRKIDHNKNDDGLSGPQYPGENYP